MVDVFDSIQPQAIYLLGFRRITSGHLGPGKE
jgi:hypothetical protein